MANDNSTVFTLDEVATYLKVGKRTVYRLASEKKIPAFKVGGTWRFMHADIDSWIKQQSMEGFDKTKNSVSDKQNHGVRQ